MGQANCCVFGKYEGLYFIDYDDIHVFRHKDCDLDGSAEAHPYYVRTAAPDDFLRSVTADHWGAGVVTSAVNTYAMLAWARRQLAADPACFIAGIR